jgi:hypothetical protein
MKIITAAMCGLIIAGSMHVTAEEIPPGKYKQATSTGGNCADCDLTVTKVTPQIVQFVSSNGWTGFAYYTVKDDKYRGALQWQSGAADYEKVVMNVELAFAKKILTLDAKSAPLSFKETYKPK